MKIVTLFLFIILGNASAEVPEILARKVTCAHLKSELQKYKSLVLVKSFLGVKKRHYVHETVNCDSDGYSVTGTFRTLDVKSCSVGMWCKYYSTSTDSDSSSSSDYGSSSWGSSDSGSSGSSGSSYDPPSSGTRGPNYDPPSSGTQGPRYCPGC